MKPLVSVVIATYSHSELLGEALDSVYAQEGLGELFDVEVIVVDDASPHDSASVVDRYPAVRFIRHPINQGPAKARNTGIQVSRGSYIAFLDDDDLWLPRKLSIQVPVLQSSPEVGVTYSTSIRRVNEQDTHLEEGWTGPSGHVFEKLLRENFVGYVTVLARSDAIAKVGYFDDTLRGLEDYDLWLRLAYRFPFRFVRGPVAIYRISHQGKFLTEIATGESRELHRRVIRKALALAPELSAEAAGAFLHKVELNNFAYLTLLPPGVAIPQMLTHLGECPRLAGHPYVRDALTRTVGRELATSSAPLKRATAVAENLKTIIADVREARRIAAAIWTASMVSLLRQGHVAAAARAAREACREDPGELLRKGLSFMRRALRGRARLGARPVDG